jgi:hypothetical protein
VCRSYKVVAMRCSVLTALAVRYTRWIFWPLFVVLLGCNSSTVDRYTPTLVDLQRSPVFTYAELADGGLCVAGVVSQQPLGVYEDLTTDELSSQLAFQLRENRPDLRVEYPEALRTVAGERRVAEMMSAFARSGSVQLDSLVSTNEGTLPRYLVFGTIESNDVDYEGGSRDEADKTVLWCKSSRELLVRFLVYDRRGVVEVMNVAFESEDSDRLEYPEYKEDEGGITGLVDDLVDDIATILGESGQECPDPPSTQIVAGHAYEEFARLQPQPPRGKKRASEEGAILVSKASSPTGAPPSVRGLIVLDCTAYGEVFGLETPVVIRRAYLRMIGGDPNPISEYRDEGSMDRGKVVYVFTDLHPGRYYLSGIETDHDHVEFAKGKLPIDVEEGAITYLGRIVIKNDDMERMDYTPEREAEVWKLLLKKKRYSESLWAGAMQERLASLGSP